MSQPSLQLVMAAVYLGSVVAALLAGKRAVPRRPFTLRFAVSNLFMLDQLSRAAGAVLRSGPKPERIVIDLSAIAYLDDSSVASLDYLCTRWASAGAAVTIEGCERNVAEMITRCGLPVLVESKPRAEVVRSELIH